MMLGMFCAAMLMGFGALVMYGVVSGSGGPLRARAIVVAAFAAATALLYARKDWSLRELRGLEIFIFATVTVYLATRAYDAVVADLSSTSRGSGTWEASLVAFALLTIAYGVAVVPNPPRRAAPNVFAIALAPLAVVLLVRAQHPGLRPALDAVAPGAAIGMSVLLGISALVAVVASFVTNKLFSTAYESRKATFYDLEERIGSGGMGEVWKASHRALARPVAVKLIREDRIAGVDRDTARRVLLRFEQEAMVTARLRSPHTVTVFDAGITADGHFYYAMEYLDGFDLENLVASFGPLPAERVIHFLLQACDSLVDAHDRGLTHRDIKPANIHVSNRGQSRDYIKLLDFGLVKAVVADDESTGLTVEGTATGTPAYMAPEMALQGEVDRRTDVYSLGCVAYWLLTGKQVFTAKGGVGLVVAHVTTPPTPPSKRAELTIPPELEEIVMKCLEKEPAQRFQSARELADALEAVPVSRPWTALRAQEWWGLHVKVAA